MKITAAAGLGNVDRGDWRSRQHQTEGGRRRKLWRRRSLYRHSAGRSPQTRIRSAGVVRRWQRPYQNAASVARAAKVAIVFVNTNETEGKDRPNLALPDHQDELIAAVASANPNTIVVLDTGGPVLMPWIGKVRGIVQAWYPGQEDGNAIAAILYGDVNPSGKLPLTFPRTATEIPTSTQEQWPGVNGDSLYSEKLDVGYRWYDAHNVEPLFPFGYGLSYTTFKLSHLSVSRKRVNCRPALLAKMVGVAGGRQTGKRAGAEVVQVYVEQPAKNGEPPRQLRAFTKTVLQPGQNRHVMLTLDQRSFSIYDPAAHAWKSPAGTYGILVGTSSRDLPLHSSITVSGAGEFMNSGPNRRAEFPGLLPANHASQAGSAQYCGSVTAACSVGPISSSSVSRFTCRREGNIAAHTPVTIIAPTPPMTTAGTAPHHCAVTPLSKLPNSLLAPTKSEFTALTRPRTPAAWQAAAWTNAPSR